MLSVIADDLSLSRDLLNVAAGAGHGVLVAHATEPLLVDLAGRPYSEDRWLTRTVSPAREAAVRLGTADLTALQSLYRTTGSNFWLPDMLAYGHYHGIYDRSGGALISAAGVNFVLREERYAQIANVATLPRYRHHGMASSCVRTTMTSLWESGITTVGLFAEAARKDLAELYGRLGFAESGRFRFVEI
jgi:GNAT superfamily N-acetyltransferase